MAKVRAEPLLEKVSCSTPAPPTTRDLPGGPFVQHGPRPIPHLLGGIIAHAPELEACYAHTVAGATEAAGRALQLTLRIHRDGSVREVEVGGTTDAAFAACVTASAQRWRYPPACDDLRVTVPLTAYGYTRPIAGDTNWPGFWEWSGFEVPPERELSERAASASRLLRNARLGQAELRLALGASSFALQAYARRRSDEALRIRQKQTLAGFAGLLEESPSHRRRAEALVALIVTLCDLRRTAEAEGLYRRLLRQRAPAPSPRQLAWAHLTMAEQAARAGERALADQRYARVLAALPAEERAYAYAYAQRLSNASRHRD